MKRKILSQLLSILLIIWICDLGGKCELVLATDASNLRTTSDGANSLVASKTSSAATGSLISSNDRNLGNLITVVGTVDGLLHGFDEQNNKRWTTDVGGGPLSSHHSSGNLDYSVVPSTDGSLLLHSVEGMRKTSVTARMLVEKAPFTTHDGLIFTSQKNSRVIGVDLGSGRVVHDVLSSGGIMGLGSEEKRTSRQGRGAIFDRDRAYVADSSAGSSHRGARDRKSHRSPFWLGRTDYTLRAFDQITGTEEFNFTYSELRPLHMAGVPLVQNSDSSRVIGQAEGMEGHIQNRPNTVPLPVPLISTPEGELYFTDTNGQIQRTYSLDYPAVSAFSVEDVGSGSGSAVRTQSGYAVQSLRLAYRMPGGECFEDGVQISSEDVNVETTEGEGETDSPMSERKRKRRKCVSKPPQRIAYPGGVSGSPDGSTPSQSNLVIVRSLNDGGLYALEMIGGSERVFSTSNGPSHGMLPMPFTPDKTVKGVTSSSPLALSLPSPSSLPLPITQGINDQSTGQYDSKDGIRKVGREELGDHSLLLKTFERVVKGQAKGQGMGIKSNSVSSIPLTPRMGGRGSVKVVGTTGTSEETQMGVEATGETAADIEVKEEVELTRSNLVGNHFVMPRRTGPVKDIARPGDALVIAPAISFSIFGRRIKSKQLSLPASEDGDDEGVSDDLNYGDGAGPALGGPQSQAQSFLEYLLADHDQSKKGGRTWSNVNSSGEESEEASGGGGGFRPKSESVTLPHSFFVRMTNYLHAVEMLMLRVLILMVSVYASLYYLRTRSIILPPPFGSLSDALISLLERIIIRPELLLRRTKSFMQLDESPRRSSEGRGESGVALEPVPVEEEDVELVEGGFTIRVGSLLLTSDVLGYGSHGTVVLRGSLNGRPVAVKRMLSRFNRAADREVSLLIRSDGHPNVVRYFLRETKNEFVYLALQLCNMSLRYLPHIAHNLNSMDALSLSLFILSFAMRHIFLSRMFSVSYPAAPHITRNRLYNFYLLIHFYPYPLRPPSHFIHQYSLHTMSSIHFYAACSHSSSFILMIDYLSIHPFILL